ncbi:MAG: mycothiol system anti-sigma-R factor [Acidimicrobiales bacterium]
MTDPTGEWHCVEAVDMLYHYIDGELTEERRIVIRRHLDDCPPCFDAFDFEVELRTVIAHKCRESVPESLRVRVAEALRKLQE